MHRFCRKGDEREGEGEGGRRTSRSFGGGRPTFRSHRDDHASSSLHRGDPCSCLDWPVQRLNSGSPFNSPGLPGRSLRTSVGKESDRRCRWEGSECRCARLHAYPMRVGTLYENRWVCTRATTPRTAIPVLPGSWLMPCCVAHLSISMPFVDRT